MANRHFFDTLTLDLLRWLSETGQPTDGVEVIATVPLLSSGDAPEYAVVLWRDRSGQAHVWTAWQYRDPWDAAEALRVLEARADGYERLARETRDFVRQARTELALSILDHAPDVPPEPGDEIAEDPDA
ncbi:hypothetical protein [Mesorhizobium sp. B2-4-17]|uniref:hypothetical protein n=1 Tax=Mesorhizobium sp. B2-4-17 TaxID=2589932 RepID=UPI00112B8169|nr:hypothetical protein [Mesorhizobium sp. B2-4-17]TPK78203.1 hypothetical protein FJ548_25045 [Mesorhizobium sp. B2-4-17]